MIGEGNEGTTGETTSQLSGAAHDVVQARDVSGGIHFHGEIPRINQTPRQLPGEVHGFVNRVADIERLESLLANKEGDHGRATVCVITGTAGVGKTSLAIRWSRQIRAQFPDGQLYVNMRGYDPDEPVSATQALGRFLEALGIAANAIPADLDARSTLYRSLLADKRVLVLLDNAANVSQVRPLLLGADGCLTLVTSRTRLSGLIARDGARRINLDLFPETEAVELLRSVMSEYRSGDSRDDIAELARLCARLPLALRIAAERAAARPHMPLSELIGDLRDESSLWVSLSSDDEEEADAVRSVFAWSYRALTQEVARMFRLLSLHPGPDFSIGAVAALAGVPIPKARQLLDSLVGAHLLEQRVHGRWYFHDLLRAYASQLATAEDDIGEHRAAIERACRWYTQAMGAAAVVHDEYYADDWGVPRVDELQLETPSFNDYDDSMTWFTAEVDNLVASVKVAAGAGLHGVAWKMAALLRTPFIDRHPSVEWLPMGELALNAALRIEDGLGEAITYIGLGIAYRNALQISSAIDAHHSALSAARRIGDRRQEAAALTLLGHSHRRGRQLAEACLAYREGLEIADAAGLTLWSVWALIGLAEALRDGFHHTEARNCLDEIADRLALRDYPGLQTERLWVLASIERQSGNTHAAVTYAQEALAIAQESGNSQYVGECEIELGRAHLAMGQPHEALAVLQHAASVERRMGDRSREADALDATGESYYALGRFDDALAFHSQALVMYRDLGDGWHTAVALINIANARRSSGLSDVLSHYQEAMQLIAPYTDPRAQSLRAQLTSILRS
jgi:tetratricopeptide (TPR) repeat protein